MPSECRALESRARTLEARLTHAKCLPSCSLTARIVSVGGRYLSAAGSSSPVRAAVTVSSPLNLSAFFDSLEASLARRALGAAIASTAKLTLMRHAASLHGRLNWIKVACAMGVRELEEISILRLVKGTYEDTDSYHARCSPALSDVTVSLLCVHAADDPLVPLHTLPLAALRANENCLLVLTRRGGHLGWTGRYSGQEDGVRLQAATWVDELCARFLLVHLTAIELERPKDARRWTTHAGGGMNSLSRL